MEKRRVRGIPSLGVVRKAQPVATRAAVAQAVGEAQAVVVTPVAAIHAAVTRVAVAPVPGVVNRALGRSRVPPAPVAGRSVNPAARKRGGKTPGQSGRKRHPLKITAPRARRNAQPRGLTKTENSVQVLRRPKVQAMRRLKLRIVPLCLA